MSVKSEIQRLNTAKNEIKSFIESKGIDLAGQTIDSYPQYLYAIDMEYTKKIDDLEQRVEKIESQMESWNTELNNQIILYEKEGL